MPGQRHILVAVSGSVPKDFIQVLDTFLKHLLGLPWIDLIRPCHVLEVHQQVSAKDGPDEAEAERHIDVEPAPSIWTLVQLVLGQQKKSEIAQPETVKSHGVGLVILAETAGSARSRCQEHIFVGDFLFPMRCHFLLQKLDQTSGGEDGGATRAYVDQFLAGIQIFAGNIGQRLGVVLQIVKSTLHQPCMFPGEPCVETGGGVPRGHRPRARTQTPRAGTGRSQVCPGLLLPRDTSGSLRTYADDERTWEVGQTCSTCEVSEQGRATGGGGDGGKGSGQREPASAKRVPDTEPGGRAECAGAGTSSSK